VYGRAERFVCCCLWSWLLIDLVHFARSARTREKMLERELAKLAGRIGRFVPSYVAIPVPTRILQYYLSHRWILPPPTTSNRFHQRSATISSSPFAASSPLSNPSPTPPSKEQPNKQTMLAHVEQVRLLVLGMEQRLQTREEQLTRTIEKAESESHRFEEARQEIAATS